MGRSTGNTKEKILSEALKLFADRGYDGVTVRDIADRLGIRQSSLYKHYQSKQDIFQSILNRMDQEYERRMEAMGLPDGEFSQMADLYGQASISDMQTYGKEILRYWTEDPYASAFRRMMMLEQYRNSDLSQMYRQYLADGVIQYMANLFSEMMDKGYFKKGDPEQMAIQFYAPIFLMMTVCDGNGQKERAKKLVEDHIKQFGERYSA